MGGGNKLYMFKIDFIKHGEISTALIDDILEIKTVAWPFDKASQLKWISNNIKDSDIHVLLYFESVLVGYLNLIDINIIVNGNDVKGLGVGNVCALERGKGWGKELLKRTNQFLCTNNIIGLLFCKKTIGSFYKQLGWQLIERNRFFPIFDDIEIETMYFNYGFEIKELKYTGRVF